MNVGFADWRTRSVPFWLEHNGWTTMVVPPLWAFDYNRNLPLFMPRKDIVFGNVSEERYREVYRSLLEARMPQIRAWIAAHQDETFYFLCACKDGQFCHRHLLAKFLTWPSFHFGCVIVPVPELPPRIVTRPPEKPIQPRLFDDPEI